MRDPSDRDVQRAKRKAVGGARKRCSKGKSCSATCIYRGKVCLADLPSSPSLQIPLVASLVSAMRDEQPSPPSPKSDKKPRRKAEFNLPSGEPAKFHTLESSEDFRRVRSETGKFSKEFHQRMGRVLVVKDKSEEAVAERAKMLQRLGISEAAFVKAIRTVSNYTDLEYKPIKKALYALLKKKPLTEEMKKEIAKAKVIEKIIAAAPKESVPKFRGFRADQQTLDEMIASAKLKGKFKEGVLSSWSTSLRVGQEFADQEKEGKPLRVIFQTINQRGMAVESITQAEREMELMTSGTAKYTHTGNYRVISHGGETYHVFDVVEE